MLAENHLENSHTSTKLYVHEQLNKVVVDGAVHTKHLIVGTHVIYIRKITKLYLFICCLQFDEHKTRQIERFKQTEKCAFTHETNDKSLQI